jgi:hypothetical protein
MLYIDVIRASLEILTLCTPNYLFLLLTKLDFFFVTIKTHTHTHIEALCSVEYKALLYQPEGCGSVCFYTYSALCRKNPFSECFTCFSQP